MKRNFFILLIATLGIFSIKSSFAQVEKIKFTYDLCGNRTDKYIIVETIKNTHAKEWSDELNDSIVKEELPVRVYPNPTQGSINIESSDYLSTGSFDIIITKNNGEIKYSGTIYEQKTILNLQAFASGVYLIKLFTSNRSIVYKIVKQ